MDLESREIMERMAQSDNIVCTNIEFLNFKDKRENELPYMHLLSKPIPNEIRNVSSEQQMRTDTFKTRVYTCDENVLLRGGNGIARKIPNCGGFECFAPQYTKEYMIVPSKHNSFQNFIVENNKNIKTNHHQLFDNVTKRM